jgi:hypothetical protein
MKYRRLLVTLVVIGVAFLAYATRPVRQPTVGELSTVWVGWADTMHYFRLQLAADGTGLCGFYERIDNSSSLHEITKWTLKGYDIEIILKPIDTNAWPVTMKGTATPGTLYLELGDGRKNGWRAKGTFEHERFIESAMESAKKRMQDYRKSEDKK